MKPMLSRRCLRLAARTVVGVLLFAQAALAIAACDWSRVAPARAFAANAVEPSCHEEPARNANLCLAHCLGADQSTDTPQVAVPALQSAPALVVPGLDIPSARAAMLRHALPNVAPPPARILYHQFLI